jgi:WD40 repeat-containing protein SMU1
MSSLDVEISDVTRLILQFLRENNLTQTMKALQQESKVSLNTVDSVQTFASDINSGRWDSVLPQVGALELPQLALMDLYEQIVFEMLELRENDTAKAILRNTEPMSRMRQDNPERYLRLEHLVQRQYFDPREAYPPGTSKEKRRAEIAKLITKEVSVVPPSRLLALLGHSLKWQQHQGMLPPGTDYDLFRGGVRAKRKAEEEKVPKKNAGVIKFGKKNHCESGTSGCWLSISHKHTCTRYLYKQCF